MKTFLAIIGGIAIYILTAILNGFVMSTLWGWFVVRMFHVAALSIPLAMGIAMLVGFLTYQYDPRKEVEKGDMGRTIAFSAIYAITTLGIGAIVHIFVA